MGQRYHALDSLRAVMMLLGILLHSAISYVSAIKGWGYHDSQTSPVYDLLVNIIHLFRMPIFFVMAGFFAALLYYKRGLRKLMINRFKRVGIPFVIFWVLLFPIVFTGFAFAEGYPIGKGVEYIRSYITNFSLSDIKTMHLWFLYYLMMIYMITACIILIKNKGLSKMKLVVDRLFVELMKSNLRVPVLSAFTLVSLIPMRLGTLDTSAVPIPAVKILFAYLIFYTFGWLLFEHRSLIDTFKISIWPQLLLAVSLIPINMYATHQFVASGLDRFTVFHWMTMGTGAVIIWLMVFSLTGLFLKYLNHFSPLGRYISDASYWVYLFHMPLIVWLSGLMGPIQISVHVKFMINCIVTFTLCFFTYHYFVRSTVVGLLLNGRKYPRSLPGKPETQKKKTYGVLNYSADNSNI